VVLATTSVEEAFESCTFWNYDNIKSLFVMYKFVPLMRKSGASKLHDFRNVELSFNVK